MHSFRDEFVLCVSFFAELEKRDTSRSMEEPHYMDSLRAQRSWSTPKAVYTLVSGLKVRIAESEKSHKYSLIHQRIILMEYKC